MERQKHRSYAIDKSRTCSHKFVPNIVPCKIQYNGKVNATRRHWNPQTIEDGTLRVHFRGRRLRGREIRLPESHQGLLIQKTDRVKKDSSTKQKAIAELEARRHELDPEDYAAEVDELRAAAARGELDGPEVGMLDAVGEFDKIVVWEHDALPDEDEDPYIRGLEELTTFAELISSCENRDSDVDDDDEGHDEDASSSNNEQSA